MAQFKYELLTPDEQRAAIEARLAALERDHLSVSMDVLYQGEAANAGLVARRDEIEATITELRKRAKALS